MANEHEWERISKSKFDETHRMAVPGGWIYQTILITTAGVVAHINSVFVPDPSIWSEEIEAAGAEDLH